MTAPITTEEIGRWISDDRNHGVNVNSGVLSDMCCEIIRNRAKLESAEKLAEAARDFATAKIDALRYQPAYGESPEDEPDPVVEAEYVWALQTDMQEALAAWEAAQ